MYKRLYRTKEGVIYPMLHINGLTKRYGKLLANDHLSFDVLPGRITILLGPNGAGKSTAIKAIPVSKAKLPLTATTINRLKQSALSAIFLKPLRFMSF